MSQQSNCVHATVVNRSVAIVFGAVFAVFLPSVDAQSPYEMEPWEQRSSALNNWPATPRPAYPGGTVSAELLRHPIPEKARVMMLKALRASDAGNHLSAIAQLKATLAKYPVSAAHVASILGVEYLRTEQYQEAAASLARSTELLPHDATNHSNFGLSLIAIGQLDHAEDELRRALILDPNLARTKHLLDALIAAKSTLVSQQR